VSECAGKQFVGIDLHRRRTVIVRTTESGKVLESVRILNDVESLDGVIARSGEDPEVVLEATYGWCWAVDALQAAGASVHLAHPLGMKAFEYRRVKNDFRDVAAVPLHRARARRGDPHAPTQRHHGRPDRPPAARSTPWSPSQSKSAGPPASARSQPAQPGTAGTGGETAAVAALRSPHGPGTKVGTARRALPRQLRRPVVRGFRLRPRRPDVRPPSTQGCPVRRFQQSGDRVVPRARPGHG